MYRRHFVLLSALVGLLLPLATIAEEEAKAPSEERLLERARSYWDAVRIRDFSTVHGLEAGALLGVLNPDHTRRSAGTSRLVSYEIKEVELDGEDAVVLIDEKYKLSSLKSPYSQKRYDPWMYIQGDWYHGQSRRSVEKHKKP